MPYNYADPINIKVELEINGVMTDVTSRTRAAGGVEITHAYRDGAIQPSTSTCELTIGNDDGYLTEDNPLSPWHPIGRGTPIRVSLTGILPSDAQRFEGEIEEMVAVYPGGASSSISILATGSLGAAAQNDDGAQSAMFRSIQGDSPGEHWPLDDGDESLTAANAVAGGEPMRGVGEVGPVFGETAGPAGHPGPLAHLGPGSGIRTTSLVAPVRSTATTSWAAEFSIRATESSSDGFLFHIATTNRQWWLYTQVNTPIPMQLQVDGTLAELAPYQTNFSNEWHHYVLTAVQNGASVEAKLYYDGSLLISGTGAFTLGKPTDVRINTTPSAEMPGVIDMALGAVAFYNSASDIDVAARYQAFLAWVGERAHTRFQRLCEEANLDVEIIGDISPEMGPQLPAELLPLLLECERAGQAVVSDSGTAGAAVYRCHTDLYNQQPRIAITNGAITKDLQPIWDNQRTVNDWTVTRRSGSFGRASDEAHVTKTRRRLARSLQANVETDDVLTSHAGMRVLVGTAPGPRYAGGGINMRNEHGALLADSVLGLRPGDRITAAATALPSQHPTGGFDQIILGWREYLDIDLWVLEPVMVPALPYNVIGRWALMSHELHSAMTTSVLTADIATTDADQPLLATSNLGSGYSITIGTEEMQVTAVADSLVTFGAVGTAAHAVNASVTPGIPASVATGNLLLALAAIRNNGVPATPAGYTRLAVFPSNWNVQLFAKIATSGAETAPTITFTDGIAGADTSAQMIRLAGKWHDVNNIVPCGGAAFSSNTSAQNITYPGLSKPDADGCIILYLGWKQDDWTSVATIAGATEIGEPATTTGDDQGIVWDYVIQTTAATIPSGVFTVTGGVSAISRGAVVALRCDYQTATVTRSINGVSATHAAGDDVTATRPMRWGLV